jgi:FAD-linked oxidoreductase
MSIAQQRQSYANWAGNEQCRPQQIVRPADEAEVVEAVKAATRAGQRIRVTGAGHSFSAVCMTDGVLLDMDRMKGFVSTDAETRRATLLPGTRIRELGDPLWDAGLCLRNQGDIDAQHIAGAIATATHGSGLRLQSFSGAVRRFRVVLASGEAVEVTESDADLMAALRVSVGMIGVVTEVELAVRNAFAMGEHLEFWSLDEVLARWDDEMANRRHFSFFWMPYSDSPDTLFMDYPEGMDMADRAMVKLYDEHPVSVLDPGTRDAGTAATAGYIRLDRPYRIYPDPDFQGEIVNRELEYFVPFERGKEAFLALRSMIHADYPDDRFPVEVRSIAADDGWLSPFYERDSIAISICGHERNDYRGFLAAVARTLDPFDARPHFGKIFYQDRDRLAQVLPRHADFCRLRKQLDPAGTFLNDQLAPLFG